MNINNLTETKISSKEIFHGKIIEVRLDTVKLPNGNESTREIVKHPGAVGIVPITDKGEVILVKQFRYPVNQEIFEIPAGKLDENEEPKACAKRELLEETGYDAKKISKLCMFYTTPGFSDEMMHLFLAENLIYQEQQLDEDEFLEVLRIPLDEAVQWIISGKIIDGKSIVGITLAKQLK